MIERENPSLATAAIFKTIVEQRRSVRSFLPDEVPEDILRSIFESAQQAPSNCNTQPWQVFVASGAARDRLKERLGLDFLAGKMTMDFPYNGNYFGEYKERQYDAARCLYEAVGIERKNKAERQAFFYKNMEFFGAPHVAFLFMPKEFGIREAADVGMYAQNLMLSMTAHGVASVPQTALGFFADQVREVLNISSDWKLLFGISFGYENTSDPANQCRTGRADIASVVTFLNN